MEFVDQPNNEANRRQRSRCSHCREPGHNRRHCPNLDVEQEAVEAPLRAQPRIEREGDEEQFRQLVLDEVGADREAEDNDEADAIDDDNAAIRNLSVQEPTWINVVPEFQPVQEHSTAEILRQTNPEFTGPPMGPNVCI